MKIPYSLLTCILFGLLSLTFNVEAFDKFSHRLICQLAFQNLSTDKQVIINNMLNDIPQQHQLLINQYNYQKPDKKINFSEACTWADAIKKAQFTQSLSSKYATFHYINIPRNNKRITAMSIQKSCYHGCIVQAINAHYQQVITLPNSWEKTQALLLLGHWLGDIHQPLHVSFRNDKGGNKTKVISAGRCKTLHWFWDSCLLQSQDKSYKHQLLSLQQLWQKTPNDNNKTSLKENTIHWANESFDLARKKSVGYCHMSKNSCERNNNPTKINTKYIQNHIPILELQIVKASKRLNILLAQITQH